MKLGVIGAVVLILGIWALKHWWWFAVDVFKALLAIGLFVGGALAVAIAVRRVLREKELEE